MMVRFWGTRGSIPRPGPGTLRYGGNTSCVEVRSAAGTRVVLDCGTGAHEFGRTLVAAAREPVSGHILISHTHWDHIQGLPFFAPLMIRGNRWDIYGPHGLCQSLRETLAGQMQYTYFPITLDDFGATVRYHDLVEGVFEIGDIIVRTHYLNHPALTLGYRLEADGVSVVYACDHEPYSRDLASGTGEVAGKDREHADFLADADLVIHDAQYTAEEYAQKVGWGHSTVDYVLRIGEFAGVKRVALTHHDPWRDDAAVDRLIEGFRELRSPEVFAAAEGQILELVATGPTRSRSQRPPADAALPPGLLTHSVLVAAADPIVAKAIEEALEADNVQVMRAADGESALQTYGSGQPSMVVLEQNPPAIDAAKLCRAMRSTRVREVPIVVIGSPADVASWTGPEVTDWLLKPFSGVYARTRLQAWLLRTGCRWLRAPLPQDEPQRLAALHRRGILDTEPDERFDRITRLAAALFDVPIALISLVDRDRQWFKSCFGLGVRETSREVSFCAHAILGHGVLVVPDTLLDPRFADNPLVTGEPRIRFYAGCPLDLPESGRVGTLCIIDVRPRRFDEPGIALLQDLAELVRQELTAA